MPRSSVVLGFMLVLVACSLVSCESFSQRAQKEPQLISTERKTLKRLTLAPDAVVFDVLIAHVPYNERDLVKKLWLDVDELDVDLITRGALNEQGFRVGIIGASAPESLSKILALKGRELRSSLIEDVDVSKVESALAPISYSKPVSLRAGMKSSIVMRSDVIPSAPILEKSHDGALQGKTYADVTPIFTVAIEQAPDGSVLFDLAPFLRYGASQSVTRFQHGQLVKTQEQPTKSFDNLRFSVNLRPGQFLVLGASDTNTNALGRYFFNEGGDDFEQTLLVLRLLVTQHDGQLDRFPDFQEMIFSEEDDYLSEFKDDFQKIAPDIVTVPAKYDKQDENITGFADYDVNEFPVFDEIMGENRLSRDASCDVEDGSE